MWRTLIVLVVVACALLNLSSAQQLSSGSGGDQNILQNPCVSKSSCRECIQTKSCAWCLQASDEYGDKPRCFQPALSSFNQCPEEFTWNPDNEQRIVIQRALTRAGSSASGGGGGFVSGATYEEGSYGSSSASGQWHEEHGASWGMHGSGQESHQITQISPQRIGLKLRISEYFPGFLLVFHQLQPYLID